MPGDSWVGLAGFAILFGLAAIGVPVAFSMGLASVVGLWILGGPESALSAMGIVGSSAFTSYALSVVPLIILMGAAAARSGMSESLFGLCEALLGGRRGRLATATVTASALFSAVCGSSVATAATMAKIALPQMRRFGYDDRLSVGAVAAGGSLGTLIPPSTVMVIYALIAEASLIDLFIAALIPGIVAALSYALVIEAIARIRPDAAPRRTGVARRPAAKTLVDAAPALALFTIMLGGLYGGIFTPTEAASIGALLSFAYLVWSARAALQVLMAVFTETVSLTATIFMLVLSAYLFSFFLSLTGLPQVLAAVVTESGFGPVHIVLLVVALYLVLGCVMESLSIMIVTIPLVLPIVAAMAPELQMTSGEAAIWFGIVVLIAVEVGLLTPPFGINIFVIKGAATELRTATIYLGAMPFWAVVVLRVIAIVLFPSIAIWLPRQF